MPIFLIPTSGDDLPERCSEQNEHVEVLGISDERFLSSQASLLCSQSALATLRSTDWDLPDKRNYALWHARKRGLHRILLLDDDIWDLRQSTLTAGAAALDEFAISGPFVDDFPDSSAMGHVALESGQAVDTFLSGSCMFLRADQDLGLFPPIYNEDWLFMVPHLVQGRIASIGTIRQKAYDPFAKPSVAAFQEPGEVIAEGLFALVAGRCYDHRFEIRVWERLLELRRAELAGIADRCRDARHLAVMEAAIARCVEIKASDCVRFISDLESDRKRWTRTLREAS